MNSVNRRLRLMSVYSIFCHYGPYFITKNLFANDICHMFYIHYPFFLSSCLIFEAVTLNEWNIQYYKGIVTCEKDNCLNLNHHCTKNEIFH